MYKSDELIDYWFLRNNGVGAKTALRILAIAYKAEVRKEGAKAK